MKRKMDSEFSPSLLASAMDLRIPDRDGVEHVFANGVRGQESVWLDLQFPGVACTAEEDMARQEYALSADLAYQVQKFGVGHHVKYGAQDFDAMDLTRAYEIVEESQRAWLTLPRIIRDRYQSWANVEAAARSGELEQLLRTAGAPAGSSAGVAAVLGGPGGTTPEAPKEPPKPA